MNDEWNTLCADDSIHNSKLEIKLFTVNYSLFVFAASRLLLCATDHFVWRSPDKLLGAKSAANEKKFTMLQSGKVAKCDGSFFFTNH